MILIIGGKAQGKTVLAESMRKENDILFDDVNDWARKQFDAGRTFEEAYDHIKKLLAEHQAAENGNGEFIPAIEGNGEEVSSENCEAILVTTEIGNGIVPMEPAERNFREWMGRLQILMASEAHTVIRVCCGLGQKIKG